MHNSDMQKIILDMDTGVDDAMAIALALSTDKIDVIGITTTFGNTTTAQATENTLKILSLLGREDIPVFRGLDGKAGEVYEPFEKVKHIHGDNGLGNITFPQSRNNEAKETAVSFIARMIEEYGKELTIITTGTLTNLAEVFKNKPELVSMTGRIVVMGGALATKGNVTATAEANIYKNRDAAAYIYSLDLDITQIGLDVTEQLALSYEDTKTWRSSHRGRLFADMVDFYIDYHACGSCFLHDPSAVLYVIKPEAFENEYFPVSIDEDGRTFADYENGHTVNVPLHVNKDVAERVIKESLKSILIP